jgi:exosome complex RNA-binding protein Csl4
VRQGKESKAEIIFINGKFIEIRISSVKGKEPLDLKNEKKLKLLVEKYRDDIVRKWVDFFVYNRKVEMEKINSKID